MNISIPKALIYGVLAVLSIMLTLHAFNTRLEKNEAAAYFLYENCKEFRSLKMDPTMISKNITAGCDENNNRRNES